MRHNMTVQVFYLKIESGEYSLRSPLSGLIISGNWKPFKNDEKCFLLCLKKALFVPKILKFLSWLFGHGGKRLDIKEKVNFKICDIIGWTANNYNTHIDQYLKK